MTASDRDRWRAALTEPVVGWDLGQLGETVGSAEPWSYDTLARELLSVSTAVLDMGTGGGEVLARLTDVLPVDTVATEGWEPNVAVARGRLAEVGVAVVPYDPDGATPLPFPDGRFDLVLNRHESFDSGEVFRVLRPGGALLTQQVDGRTDREIRALFGSSTTFDGWSVDSAVPALQAAGFEITRREEWTGSWQLHDVDALVRYLAHVPWNLPAGATADEIIDVVEGRCDDPDLLTLAAALFVVVARRPDPPTLPV